MWTILYSNGKDVMQVALSERDARIRTSTASLSTANKRVG
jgi:hypothetical protein